jgi:hypothetical protein
MSDATISVTLSSAHHYSAVILIYFSRAKENADLVTAANFTFKTLYKKPFLIVFQAAFIYKVGKSFN